RIIQMQYAAPHAAPHRFSPVDGYLICQLFSSRESRSKSELIEGKLSEPPLGMKLATKTIKGLAKLVTGDANLTPYKSGPALVEFFNAYGGNDVYPRGGGFPSRWQYAESKLFELNGSPAMRSLICQILDPREY